jgi:hypothetical protein
LAEEPSRGAVLERLSKIDGFYVPALFAPGEAPRGKLKKLELSEEQMRLPGNLPTTAIVTPATEFSDKFLIEMSRGCPEKCRYCWATFGMGRFRWHPTDAILGSLERARPVTPELGFVATAVGDHPEIERILREAGEMGFRILLASVGFEAFDDRLLKNFNKGVDVKTNLDAVRLMRQLKQDFPAQWAYSREQGALHGFIHPTPWDTKETAAEIQKTIYLHGLQNDILPPHSTPLIIHHASGLAHWIREIERREGLRFERYGSIIGWWDEPQQEKAVESLIG